MAYRCDFYNHLYTNILISQLSYSKRGLASMSDELSNCRFKNKKLGKEIKKKEDSIQDLDEQVDFFHELIYCVYNC